MSVAALATLRLVEYFNLQELALLMACDDHLGNAFTVVDDKILCREVDEQYSNFATVVSVNRSWCIQHCNALFQRQTAAWTYLSLIAFGQCDMQSRRYQSPLHGVQCDGCVQIGPQIHTGTLWRGIRRQGLMSLIYDFYFHTLLF